MWDVLQEESENYIRTDMKPRLVQRIYLQQIYTYTIDFIHIHL